MTLSKRLAPALWIVCAATAWSAPKDNTPYVAYLYPAGGQQGTAFQLTAGGQSLRSADGVYVSGEGVTASIMLYEGPFGLLSGAQSQELELRLKELRENLRPDRPGKNKAEQAPAKGSAAPDASKPEVKKRERVALPDFPELRNLEQLNLRQLKEVEEKFIVKRKDQAKPPMAERVTIAVAIAPDAAPGDREVRFRTPHGLTNPIVFQVGRFPEVRQPGPHSTEKPPTPPFAPPVVLNGRTMPGQVERFRLSARKGQKLVIAAQARHLIPYLADAVPGWFQATLTLYDPKGRELAFADHYRFDPDPVLFCEIPEDGEYALEVHDSIYRGREDFIYRVSVAEQPFITEMFPLGGQTWIETTASVSGWNLPQGELRLDTKPGPDGIRQAAWRSKDGLSSNCVPYAVNALPDCEDLEPNHIAATAQRITLPVVINGRIKRNGDVNVFRFEGRAGDDVVAEVYARRLGSPLDSLLRLADSSGRVLAWNDDYEDKGMGLLTHQADSYLRARLPADGTYYVYLTDAENAGSDAHAYRLRISAPMPDFALRMTPASINVPARCTVPVTVYALRQDGFNGDIDVALKNGPAGLTLAGARIPGGRDHVRMTLTGPPRATLQPVVLQFEGSARIGGATVRRPVVPADDMMQAFAYEHVVPAQEFLAEFIGGPRWLPHLALADAAPVNLPAGGTAQVRVHGLHGALTQGERVELSEPPKGVTIEDSRVDAGNLTLTLKAGPDAPPAGYADNLIIVGFVEKEVETRKGGALRTQRTNLGLLPAIPFRIVAP